MEIESNLQSPISNRLSPRVALALTTPLTRSARLGLTFILALYGFWILRDVAQFRLLDNIDLAIHEAGHVFFGPFGEFIGFLGGTLFQLIVPATFLGYFLIKMKDQHAASVMLWWIAQNLWNISVYIKDAQTQYLHLVGGGVHDWGFMLAELDVIQQEQEIGQAVLAVGVLLFIASIGWGFLASRRAIPEHVDD